MKNILLISHIFPPAVDGGSKVIAKLGEYLKKEGHNTYFLASNLYSSDDFTHPTSTHTPTGLNVITFFHRPLKLLARLFPTFRIFAKGPIFNPISFLKEIREIILFKPDLIISGPFPTTISIYAYFIKKIIENRSKYRPKLIIIPCFHPNDPDFQNQLLKNILKQADLIIALTTVEKKLLSQITQAKIIVSNLGVDPKFLINHSRIKFPKYPNILFIANFSAHKRTSLLITTYLQLKKQYPHLSLTLLGQKTLYWPQIEKVIPKKSEIKIIFSPTTNEIIKAIDQSTLLCLPSIHESFGLVFIESLARGKPVIGADTPQTQEVIKKLGGGLTFTADSDVSLFTTISTLLSDPALCRHLGYLGYIQVKNRYTWTTITNKLCPELFS